RASVLAAFRAADGCRDDGHASARTWLQWKTQITDGAAAGAIGWMRRLAAHPLVRGALADGEISTSWAKQICQWTGKVPAEIRDDADSVLLAAARGGMELEDIGGLAEEIQRQTARPDTDGPDDGFDDRSVSLETTFGGAGTLRGNLAPSCTAALTAVLESLGKRAGPEDLRSRWQRQHDALEEACRLLIGSNCLPDRAGQPTQIVLHMDLDRLRGMPGAAGAEAAFPGPAAPPGAECDATIVPVVTGHVDPVALDRLAALVRGHGTGGGDAETARRELSAQAARRTVLAAAADVLSGPAGLAAYLRTGTLGAAAAAISLPLDTGTATDAIPAHLRRLVILRDRHCRWPGCCQPPARCHPHHIRPRHKGGKNSLANLALLCAFHHLASCTARAGRSSSTRTGP
ncbi:MAG TPA: DUF222 domain-containing protein, partial [Streptosporangiaceae bacterium]|nr:DUF222 domain-containing protein [Streptosporangiaceae bacterium]